GSDGPTGPTGEQILLTSGYFYTPNLGGNYPAGNIPVTTIGFTLPEISISGGNVIINTPGIYFIQLELNMTGSDTLISLLLNNIEIDGTLRHINVPGGQDLVASITVLINISTVPSTITPFSSNNFSSPGGGGPLPPTVGITILRVYNSL
ncbi:hypothetical protein ACX16J_30910, partial [Bacillus cereus]